MSQITFLGAAGTVTGSRHLLEIQNKKYLIDCGLFQGNKQNRQRNWDVFPVPPGDIDKVFLTHAHIDHTGYLPKLCKIGFKGRVLCTHATHELADILLHDSAHLQEEDARWANKKGFTRHKPALPLYTREDVDQAMRQFKPLYFGEDYRLNDEVRIKFRDSGHMLGSAFIDIKSTNDTRSKKILFSGDMGRSSRPILKDPEQVYNVDYLVLESTYGMRLHENTDPKADFVRVVNESLDRGGVLVIPAFSIGRTQTVLYVLKEFEQNGLIPKVPVYVDSPMAIEATAVYEKRLPELDLDSRIHVLRGEKIFRPEKVTFCPSREESKQINEVDSGAIIISASGMATGGRILHHLLHRLPDSKNTVLIIGYQAEGTRGRTILEKEPTVKIHGRHIPINCRIENIDGFSGHADYEEILAWLMGFNRPPEKTFLVHGEPEACNSLAEKIRNHFGWDVVIPEYEQSFELDI